VERIPEKTIAPSSRDTELLETPPITVSFCTNHPSIDAGSAKFANMVDSTTPGTVVGSTVVVVAAVVVVVTNVVATDGVAIVDAGVPSEEFAQLVAPIRIVANMTGPRMPLRITVCLATSTPTGRRLAHPPLRLGRGRRVRSTNERK
jgi:hypothetical protein